MKILTREEEGKIRRRLNEFIKDGGATMSKDEFVTALELLDIDVTKTPLSELTAECTKDGEVNIVDFLDGVDFIRAWKQLTGQAPDGGKSSRGDRSGRGDGEMYNDGGSGYPYMTPESEPPPAYSSTPGIPLNPVYTGGPVAQRPPPPYEAPRQIAGPPPPAYSSTPGIPLNPVYTGGPVAQRPPPPYEAPLQIAGPPPRRIKSRGTRSGWCGSRSCGGRGSKTRRSRGGGGRGRMKNKQTKRRKKNKQTKKYKRMR